MKVKFPEVNVSLIGLDGNAFVVLGTVKKALKQSGISEDDISKYIEEATSGDYDHLLGVTMKTVSCG